jgi:effector-binding domain-containing protein
MPEIRTIEPQPAITVEAVTDHAGIPALADQHFPALLGKLREAGLEPSGAPFIRYFETGEQFSLQLGIPAPEGVATATLPGGRVAVYRHVGDFSGLPNAFTAAHAWAQEQGEQPAGGAWESYVTDPREEPDSSKWITDIVVPLA